MREKSVLVAVALVTLTAARSAPSVPETSALESSSVNGGPVMRPALLTLQFSASTIGGGDTVTATVTRPTTGSVATFAISNGNPAVLSMPAQVSFAATAATASFVITSTPVAQVQSVNVVVGPASSAPVTGTLTVNPPSIASATLSTAAIAGGGTVTLTVQLATPAPSGGLVVTLVSSDPAAVVPPQVTVPAASRTVVSSVQTTSVASNRTATLTTRYTAGAFSTQRTASLSVLAPAVLAVTFVPATVREGYPATGTVTLTGPAPSGGIPVSLTLLPATSVTLPHSSYPATVGFPAQVTVPSGALSVTFTITPAAHGQRSTGAIDIRAASASSQATGVLTVSPILVTITGGPTPGRIHGGDPSTVTLRADTVPAPSGLPVTLRPATGLALCPRMIATNGIFPAGTVTTTFALNTQPVSRPCISQYRPNSVPASDPSATLQLDAPEVVAFSIDQPSFVSGSLVEGILKLDTDRVSPGGARVRFTLDQSIQRVTPGTGVIGRASFLNTTDLVINRTEADSTLALSFPSRVVAVPTTATISVAALYDNPTQLSPITRTATVQLLPHILTSVVVRTPALFRIGSVATGTVTLNGGAFVPNGTIVTLSSTGPITLSTTSVVVGSGLTTATFTVTAKRASGGSARATVTATYNGSTVTDTFTVLP